MNLGRRTHAVRVYPGNSVLLFAVLLQLLVLSACGPSLRSTIDVPKVRPLEVPKPAKKTVSDTYIFVDEFIDGRQSKAVAVMEGREVNPANEITPRVVEGLRWALERKGFQFSDTAPIILSGEVRKWRALVEPGFASKVVCDAGIYVEILDPANKRIYSGLYTGYASKETPGLDKRDVQEVLKTSMYEAISQVLRDEQLINLLSSY